MVGVAAALAELLARSCDPPTGTPKEEIHSLLNYHSLKPSVLMLLELIIQDTEKSLYLVLVL